MSTSTSAEGLLAQRTSPWVQRRAASPTAAVLIVDQTLGDHVIADDWTGTNDYYHAVRRGLLHETDTPLRDRLARARALKAW